MLHGGGTLAARHGRGVELLNERFCVYELAAEGDWPRRATLWLHRALYKIEVGPVVASKSIIESRAISSRVGGAQPQFKALLATGMHA